MFFRRFVVAFAGVSLVVIMGAPVAAADPAQPTNYRSTVDAVTPATNAITIKVVGGDGFLDLDVKRGHTAAVAGYQGEPWLRVLANGIVQENQSSPATYLNENRYGKAPVPANATAEAATTNPRWKTVGRSGSYMWHDHRIHYMTPQVAPRLIPGTNRVAISDRADGRWVVAMTVDGRATRVFGELTLSSAPSPATAWLIALGVAVVLIVISLGWRGTVRPLIATATIIVSALATWSGWRELEVIPKAAGGNPISVALPAAAIFVTLLSLALRNAASRTIAMLAGAAALGAWSLLRVQSFGKAYPLTSLSPALGRAIAAAVLGVAVASVVGAFATGGLSLPGLSLDLDADDVSTDSPQPTEEPTGTSGRSEPGSGDDQPSGDDH